MTMLLKGEEFPSGIRYRWKESKGISADSRLLRAPLSRRLSLGNSSVIVSKKSRKSRGKDIYFQ